LKGNIFGDALPAGMIIDRLHHIGMIEPPLDHIMAPGQFERFNRTVQTRVYLLTTRCILHRKYHRTEGIKARSNAAIAAKTVAITTNQIESSIVSNIQPICLKWQICPDDKIAALQRIDRVRLFRH
jgi:hypothetical protein